MFSSLWIYNKIHNRRIFQMLPSLWRGAFDLYFFRESLSSSLGKGAFNGQEHRQKIVCELLTNFQFAEIIETGTYRGRSTTFFHENFNKDIYTVEKNSQFFHFSRLLMRDLFRVHLFNDDSVSFLQNHIFLDSGKNRDSHILFYLDAHWELHLPLLDELRVIFAYYHHPIIIIDDFQVPGDTGYRFDDYGDGKKICLEYLTNLNGEEFFAFFPSLSSLEETGARRGCVVLTLSESDAEIMKSFSSLHLFG